MLIEFDAETFVWMITITLMEKTYALSDPNSTVKTDTKNEATDTLKDVGEACEKLHATLTFKHIKTSLKSIGAPDFTHGSMIRVIEEVRSRLADELGEQIFFQMAPATAKYYNDLQPFGQDVAQRFPQAITDIEEAAKCLAVGYRISFSSYAGDGRGVKVVG